MTGLRPSPLWPTPRYGIKSRIGVGTGGGPTVRPCGPSPCRSPGGAAQILNPLKGLRIWLGPTAQPDTQAYKLGAWLGGRAQLNFLRPKIRPNLVVSLAVRNLFSAWALPTHNTRQSLCVGFGSAQALSLNFISP